MIPLTIEIVSYTNIIICIILIYNTTHYNQPKEELGLIHARMMRGSVETSKHIDDQVREPSITWL
jgi:hypothetical protein